MTANPVFIEDFCNNMIEMTGLMRMERKPDIGKLSFSACGLAEHYIYLCFKSGCKVRDE